MLCNFTVVSGALQVTVRLGAEQFTVHSDVVQATVHSGTAQFTVLPDAVQFTVRSGAIRFTVLLSGLQFPVLFGSAQFTVPLWCCTFYCTLTTRSIASNCHTFTHILNVVLAAHRSDDIALAGLLHLSTEDELVEDEEGLLEVEDDVQLADLNAILSRLLGLWYCTNRAEVFVEQLHIAVDDFEYAELVVVLVHTGDEVQRCVPKTQRVSWSIACLSDANIRYSMLECHAYRL